MGKTGKKLIFNDIVMSLKRFSVGKVLPLFIFIEF